MQCEESPMSGSKVFHDADEFEASGFHTTVELADPASPPAPAAPPDLSAEDSCFGSSGFYHIRDEDDDTSTDMAPAPIARPSEPTAVPPDQPPPSLERSDSSGGSRSLNQGVDACTASGSVMIGLLAVWECNQCYYLNRAATCGGCGASFDSSAEYTERLAMFSCSADRCTGTTIDRLLTWFLCFQSEPKQLRRAAPGSRWRVCATV